MTEKERIEKYTRRYAFLKDEAKTWTTHCREVQEFAIPTHGRYLSNTAETTGKGDKKHSSVYNGAATFAVWVLSAGIHNNLTSPTKPWYRLSLEERELLEFEGAREWLEAWTKIGLGALSSSNFYNASFTSYTEIVGFGTTAILIEDLRPKYLIRFTPLTFGEYFLGLDEGGECDTLYRRIQMTTLDMVRRFGKARLSQAVKSALAHDSTDDKWEVIHVIEPRDVQTIDREDRGTSKAYKWASVYFEESNKENILGESGYKTCPFAAARWRVNAGDTYGRSPVMECLGDIKELQYLEKITAQGLGRQSDPTLSAPSSMKKLGRITTRAGEVNWYDGVNADAIKPSFAINMDMNGIRTYKQEVETRIRRFLFNELFMAITDMDRQMTATEVRARQIERLTVLGPVVQQLQQTFLTPVLERVYQILYESDRLPPPPAVLQGHEWTLDYTGLLAQAQRATDTMAIDALITYMASFANAQAAQGSITVLDKMDFDQAVDEVGDMTGAPAKVIRSDEAVAEIRRSREAAAQAQAKMQALTQAAETAAPLARAAKDASETTIGGANNKVLDMFLGVNQ